MSWTAASCRRRAAPSCSSRARSRKRSTRWTPRSGRPKPGWSGNFQEPGGGDMNRYLLGIAGIVVILGFAFALSSNRRAIRLRVVGSAFALQAGIAVLVLYTDWGKAGIASMSRGVANLL